MRRFWSGAFLAALIFAALAPWPARAQQDSNYAPAERLFQSLDLDTRLYFQIFLTSAGYWSAVPNVSYSRRLHGAILRLQQDRGEAPTGILSRQQVDQIFDTGAAVMNGWRLRSVTHPSRPRTLWVPSGLGLLADRTEHGALIRDSSNRFRLKFQHFGGVDVASAYDVTLQEMTRSGDAIVYKLVRQDFFVVHGRQGRYNRYVRYHADDGGILGFDMSWSTEEAPVFGTRLVTIVSGSFWASMTGAPYPRAAPLRYPWEQGSEAARAPEPRTPAPQPTPSVAPKPPEAKVVTGTGFFVGAEGHVVTNNHVVESCGSAEVRSAPGEREVAARIVARDPKNDLALLKTSLKAPRSAPIRSGVRLGEPIALFGFPHADLLARSGNFTLGNVTALAGIGDDSTKLQMSAPVQMGNSGGPLLDHSGNLVGVVVSKLGLKVAVASGDLPQNVNFAIKSAVVAGFLDSHGVGYAAGSPAPALAAPDLADLAKELSVFIVCRP